MIRVRAAARSDEVREPGSAITPIAVMPATPQEIAASMIRAWLSRSRSPDAVKVVGAMYHVPENER